LGWLLFIFIFILPACHIITPASHIVTHTALQYPAAWFVTANRATPAVFRPSLRDFHHLFEVLALVLSHDLLPIENLPASPRNTRRHHGSQN